MNSCRPSTRLEIPVKSGVTEWGPILKKYVLLPIQESNKFKFLLISMEKILYNFNDKKTFKEGKLETRNSIFEIFNERVAKYQKALRYERREFVGGNPTTFTNSRHVAERQPADLYPA
jgi:hypothetical protein